MNLQGKTILVVGGAAGIGQATARLCAERGAKVIVADFNAAEGTATAQAINGTFIQVDVTAETSVQALCQQIAHSHEKLDGLIRKYYLMSEDGQTAGGIYLWESKAKAEAWYNAEWVKNMTAAWGEAPMLEYLDCPVVVDAARVITG